MGDRMEEGFEALCLEAGIKYVRDDRNSGLDFYLPDFDVYVEVKRFHSDRIAGQMARRPNVIAIQGLESLLMLHKLLTGRT